MISLGTFLQKSLSTAILLTSFFVLSSQSAGAITYTFDARHRLIGAVYDNGVNITYSYDSVGNRLTYSSTEPVYTLYEDAEDGTIDDWEVYDNDHCCPVKEINMK